MAKFPNPWERMIFRFNQSILEFTLLSLSRKIQKNINLHIFFYSFHMIYIHILIFDDWKNWQQIWAMRRTMTNYNVILIQGKKRDEREISWANIYRKERKRREWEPKYMKKKTLNNNKTSRKRITLFKCLLRAKLW